MTFLGLRMTSCSQNSKTIHPSLSRFSFTLIRLFFVGVQLFSPKRNVALWLPVALNTPMPKATVDEYRCFSGLVGQVWLSENRFVVNSVSLSLGPQKFSYCCLGLCVFGPDAGHYFASLFWAHPVWHTPYIDSLASMSFIGIHNAHTRNGFAW